MIIHPQKVEIEKPQIGISATRLNPTKVIMLINSTNNLNYYCIDPVFVEAAF